MNADFTRVEFEALPFRDDLANDPSVGQFYRLRGDARTVVQCVSLSPLRWDAWQYEIIPDDDDE